MEDSEVTGTLPLEKEKKNKNKNVPGYVKVRLGKDCFSLITCLHVLLQCVMVHVYAALNYYKLQFYGRLVGWLCSVVNP